MANTTNQTRRREFMIGAATVGALCAVPVTAWARQKSSTEPKQPAPANVEPNEPPPRPRSNKFVHGVEGELMGLSQGTRIGPWTAAHVQDKQGSYAIVLEHPSSEPIQLDVVRAGGSVEGVVQTSNFSIFVANGATGSSVTSVEQLAAAGALGAYLRMTERRMSVPNDLMTFEERASNRPRGNFRAI